MILAPRRDAIWLHSFFALALVVSIPRTTLLAQGLEDPEAVETIIGSDVAVEEAEPIAEEDAVIAALENTQENISEVRKKFALDKVEIVFLPDMEDASTPIAQKVEEHQEEIAELHQTIEGNPMFYHAANSRSLMVADIVALEFDDENGVKIYATGEAPAE